MAKRKLKIEDQVKIINRLDEGEEFSKIAERYRMTPEGLYDLVKKREQILKHAKKKKQDPVSNRRGNTPLLQNCMYPEVETKLFQWYSKQSAKRKVFTEEIREQAMVFFNEIVGVGEFKASGGWLEKFKKRFGLHLREAGTADKFLGKYRNRVADLNLVPDQIYSIDKTALYWKSVPKVIDDQQTLNTTDKIVFLTCSNASGTHRLPLLVIGKDKSFLQDKNLPVCYKNNIGTEWVSLEVLRTWFHTEFVPNVENFMIENNLPVKALLLMNNGDNYSSEGEFIDEKGVISTLVTPAKYMPGPVRSDRPVVQMVNFNYKKELLLNIIVKEDIHVAIQGFNLKDACHLLAKCWNEIPSHIIRKSWAKLFPDFDPLDDIEDDDPFCQSIVEALMINCNYSDDMAYIVKNWLAAGEDDTQFPNENEILLEILSVASPHEDDDNNDSPDKVDATDWQDDLIIIEDDKINSNADKNVYVHSNKKENTRTKGASEEIVTCFDKCISWAESSSISIVDIEVLQKLRDRARNTTV